MNSPAAGNPGGASAARALAASIALLAVVTGGVCRAAGVVSDSPRSGAAEPDDSAILQDRASPPAARAAAARRMLETTGPEARARLVGLLQAPAARGEGGAGEEGTDAAGLVLREIAGLTSAPPWLSAPLSQVLKSGTTARREMAAAALASVRTRDAVRSLLERVGDDAEAAPVRGAAFRALSRLTGMDLGTDPKRWSLWFAQVEWLPEAEWRRVLAESLASRADRSAGERDRSLARLTAQLRKDYLDLATPETRAGALEGFIRDDVDAVRGMGFVLALQELANARPLDHRVSRAALGVLGDPSAEMRRSAAELLNAMAPPDLAPAMRDALAVETDATVAAFLLRAMARWPDPAATPVVMRWLGEGEPARAPALDAVAALLDAGLLGGPESRDRALAAVREPGPESLSPSGLRLLFALGDESDRRRISGLLSSGEAARRREIGEAIAADPRALDGLVEAAKADSAMFQACAGAIMRFKASPPGFALLGELPAPSAEVRRQAQSALAARLSPSDLLAVARAVGDPAMRESLLARLTSEPLRTRFRPDGDAGDDRGQARFTQHPGVIAGLLLLCQTRLELGEPAAALKAVDALAPAADGVDAGERDALKTIALLCLDRTDEALALRAPVSAWVEGLERSMNQPHAGAILRIIDGRFGAEVDPESAARLRPLRDRLNMAVGPMPEAP